MELPEVLDPMTSTHPAVAAWRVFNPEFGLSLAQQEAVCLALVARERERIVFLQHGSTEDWARDAGKQF